MKQLLNSLSDGGGERDRTDGLLVANQALSQLSYTPGAHSPVCPIPVRHPKPAHLPCGRRGLPSRSTKDTALSARLRAPRYGAAPFALRAKLACQAEARLPSPSGRRLVGLGRLELPTSRLSGVRSNHLSYRPMGADRSKLNREGGANRIMHTPQRRSMRHVLHRKEVIQPQVPLRLPCYDFTPITSHTLGGCLLAVSSPTSGITDFRGVTGGVYKARERIHRSLLICDY